jgi:hypothetical protein
MKDIVGSMEEAGLRGRVEFASEGVRLTIMSAAAQGRMVESRTPRRPGAFTRK